MYYTVQTTVLTPAASLPLESSTLSRVPVMSAVQTLKLIMDFREQSCCNANKFNTD